jgi:hypothetical protein
MAAGPATETKHSITIDDNGRTGYVRKFIIPCDPGTTRLVALLAAGMPRWRDVHPEDPNARVSNITADYAVESCDTIYEATATYSTSTPDEVNNLNRENPIEDPPKYSFKTIRDKRICEKDQNGKVYMNSSKVLFDPPFERQWNRRAITVERNEAVYSTAYADQWQNVINSEPWGAYAARKAMIVSIDANNVFERGMHFWRVTYEIEINPEGWQPSLLDRGLHILDADGKPKPIEREGVRLSEPVLLNGSGVESTGTPPTAHYIDFEEYDERPFSDINLPAPV